MIRSFIVILIAVMVLFSGCNHPEPVDQTTFDKESAANAINTMLDEWHDQAAAADYAYFDKMAPDGIFIGTDKTELWNRDEFREWCKPFFDEGRGWDFDLISRNIYFGESGQYAWFDEMLDTWMGDCRASGVVHHTGGSWKIEHYQLSVTVPNDTLDGFIPMIRAFEAKQKTAGDSLSSSNPQ